MRVTNSFQNQQSILQIQKSNEQLGKLSSQITSGNISEKLSEIANKADDILDLRAVKKNTETYITNLESAKKRVEATESALQALADLLQEAKSVSTLGRSEKSADARAALAPKAQALTESFYSIFTTEFEGRYIFSGENGLQTPTNATPTATAFPGFPVPTTYYNGDSNLNQVITGFEQTLSYGVAGNDDTFANMKAGLEALWYGLENNSISDMDNAITVLNQTQTDLSAALANVGGQLSNITLQTNRHNTNLEFTTQRLDELDKVDITEALTQFTQEQATLEASMLVITQLNQLSLLDFL